jgi:hypothetical protein
MYDPSGADADREWIEINNGTANSVDLTDWSFFEADTNHALTLVQGSETVSAGDFAIIAEDAPQFLLDYPAYTGTLFDTAFVLLNTGETIAIKDSGGVVVDEVTYASSQGAADDGNSLQKSENGWVAAAPTPGT